VPVRVAALLGAFVPLDFVDEPPVVFVEGRCVEVARGVGAVGVRDSKGPSGPVLAFAPDRWALLTERL